MMMPPLLVNQLADCILWRRTFGCASISGEVRPLCKSGFVVCMKQHTRRLFDQVRACPATVGSAEGVRYGFRAAAGECAHCAHSTE